MRIEIRIYQVSIPKVTQEQREAQGEGGGDGIRVSHSHRDGPAPDGQNDDEH